MGLCNFGGAVLSVLLPFLICRAVNCTTARYSTHEEDAPGTEIGNLSRDLNIDPAEDPQTSFRFMQETQDSAIEMRERDGLLSVGGETIDREQLCPGAPRCLLSFDIVAFSKEKFHLIHVEVELLDINDHSPGFLRNETRLEILENSPLFSRFQLEAAIDLDVGLHYIQSYNITDSAHFILEDRVRDDGFKFAELVLVKELDREVEDRYTLELTATDGGVPPRSGSVTVHITVLDFNDNSPIFDLSSLRVELLEDAPVGHRVLRVRAQDPDQGVNGEVTYAFVDGPLSETMRVFHLDAVTGDVTLKSLVDFEKRRSYEFNIRASDSGVNSVPSTCRVLVDVVDVNDNAPEITIKPMKSTSDGVALITEAAATESFVALISTLDRDSGPNGRVHTSLHGHAHFKLQQAYGDAFLIVTTTTLDREKVPEYNLTVVAEDRGSPPFRTSRQYTIRVGDENDNAPLFSRALYDISVLENNVPGSYIATVVARDSDTGPNARVSYSLLDSELPGGAGRVSGYVSIDPLSGSLYSLRSFDHEALRGFELRVQAEDHGAPPRAAAAAVRIRVVDQNDNTPYFSAPVLRNGTADVPLAARAPAGHLALRLRARDADQGVHAALTYRLVRGDASLFSVDARTGEVVLRRRLQAAVGEALELGVAVSDGGGNPRTAHAALWLVVSEAEPSGDRALVAVASGGDGEEDSPPGLDGSLVVIVMLSGGCALLLVAIVIVIVTFRLNRGGARAPGAKGEPWRAGLFDGRSAPPFDGSAFGGRRAPSPHRDASSLDDCGQYEEGSGDSETQMVLPSRPPFHPAPAWQGDQYCLQVSGHTDQFSVKDSGKGDSDFNDSDSDLGGDTARKHFSTFQTTPRTAVNVADTPTADWLSTSSADPGHGARAGADPAPCTSYTVGFSSAAVYNHPHAFLHTWKSSGYGAVRPLAGTGSADTRGCAPAPGTLPSYFVQHQQLRREPPPPPLRVCGGLCGVEPPQGFDVCPV
ncbi:protocadherin-8 [Gadus chalcogrammus]|uniref:protocadherin-8 n=1 Tax=Gadus chalcogrammus TaxID=1042646 RepID=UPI0024C4CD77|nr:protocadherin-8 [Gadus chalcogrammus]